MHIVIILISAFYHIRVIFCDTV